VIGADAAAAPSGQARGRPAIRLLPACLALTLAACVHPQPLVQPDAPVEFSRYLTFYDHPLELHYAKPANMNPGAPLLLFATGDGGWRGKDLDAYRHLIRWGYPVVGFSAPSYLKHLGFVSGTTTPERLAHDYQRIITTAVAALELPADTSTILVGISRGAGLAVVAAGRQEIHAGLAGVLAVALTKEEEYVRHYRVKRGESPSDMPTRELVEFQTYEYLDQLRAVPLVVIQSTRDSYLPADAARALFGPDTESRKLYAIPAQNHGFGGARGEMFARMADSLRWLVSTHDRLSTDPTVQRRP
jgi:hypothetical protein